MFITNKHKYKYFITVLILTPACKIWFWCGNLYCSGILRTAQSLGIFVHRYGIDTEHSTRLVEENEHLVCVALRINAQIVQKMYFCDQTQILYASSSINLAEWPVLAQNISNSKLRWNMQNIATVKVCACKIEIVAHGDPTLKKCLCHGDLNENIES